MKAKYVFEALSDILKPIKQSDIKDKILLYLKKHPNVDLYTIKKIIEPITFNNDGWINLIGLKSIPPGMIFNNNGWINLNSLESLPLNTQFNNYGTIYLQSLKHLPEGFVFSSKTRTQLTTRINLNSLESLPSGIKFTNPTTVELKDKVVTYEPGQPGKIDFHY